MNGGEILITIIINCLIIYFLHVLHKRSIAKTLQHLRKEVNEMENLVAAIIEEFEDVAERVWPNEPERPTENSIEPQAVKEESVQAFAEPFADFLQLTEEEPLSTPKATGGEPLGTLNSEESVLPETLPMFPPQELVDPKHQRIMQLWKEGLAIEEIAKQLGTGRGEVQLVLGIYKRS
ncbi:MAG: DUF6115 domain-containing protein [Bacteroidota bacterium]